jgi:hypothetical protein
MSNKILFKIFVFLLIFLFLGCEEPQEQKDNDEQEDDDEEWSFNEELDGHEPVTEAPDSELLEKAILKLNNTGILNNGETEILLKQVSYVFRSCRRSLDINDIRGWCDPARDLAYYTLIDMGIDEADIYLNSTTFSLETYFIHQFLVVRDIL